MTESVEERGLRLALDNIARRFGSECAYVGTEITMTGNEILSGAIQVDPHDIDVVGKAIKEWAAGGGFVYHLYRELEGELTSQMGEAFLHFRIFRSTWSKFLDERNSVDV